MLGVGFAKSVAPLTSKEIPSFTGDIYALNRSPPTRKQIPNGAGIYNIVYIIIVSAKPIIESIGNVVNFFEVFHIFNT